MTQNTPAESDALHCHRKACRAVLDGVYYQIWNDPSVTTPNVYCVRCGRKIIEFNIRDDELRLRYEVQVPIASTKEP
jgi:hypothetical protein